MFAAKEATQLNGASRDAVVHSHFARRHLRFWEIFLLAIFAYESGRRAQIDVRTKDTTNNITLGPTDQIVNASSLPKERRNKNGTSLSWLPYTERPFDYMLQHIWAKGENCHVLAKYLRDRLPENAPQDAATSHFVNTEMLIKKKEAVDPRKEQLPILSFLATQHQSLTLNILVSDENALKNPPKWLDTLLDHQLYGKRIRLQYFDPARDMEQLHLSKSETESIQHALSENGVKHLASVSDIRRYAVLFIHGGIWFDTDTIFLSDVRPLMGVDSVSLTQGKFFNNAVVSTSRPHSDFMKMTLKKCAHLFQSDPKNENYFRFGPSLFGDMRNDMSETMSFKALPGCLVDTSWVGGFKGALGWDEIFDRNATEENLAFLLNEQGPFSFHWHGRWDKVMKQGSSASIAHAHYVRELGLDPAEFGAARELNLTAWSISKARTAAVRNNRVSCGNHDAPSCEECPQGNGAVWCNGGCIWDVKANKCSLQQLQEN